MSTLHDLDVEEAEQPTTTAMPPTVTPVATLNLRIRMLYALLYGTRPDAVERKHSGLKNGETLARSAEELQRKFDAIIQSNDGLRKFMEHYGQYAQYLTPAFALSGTIPTAPPTYDNMTSAELDALLSEMEPDIRAADHQMREIIALEEKGVAGAGKLAEHKALQPRLEELIKMQQEDQQTLAALEKRIATLIVRHATNSDALSELFVMWDEALRDASEKVRRTEREIEERRRLGYE